jgi:DNA topoisomerase-2
MSQSKKQKTSSNNKNDSTKSVDDKYQEMELREHILLRPDSYVGGVDIIGAEEWVPENVEDGADLSNIKQYTLQKLKYCPAFLKIFDEIVVNVRDAGIRDQGVTNVKIDINRFENSVSVWNNATTGIPIEKLKSGLYAPESIFGKLLTGENFKDWEGKITGGKNGYGSKCVSPDTLIPLWDGSVKYAKNVTLDDKLIGDDGSLRSVKNIITGSGKMFEVTQMNGDSYKVNDQHTLTLQMPDHKVIFWNASKNGWTVLWWDNDEKCINAYTERVASEKKYITCSECGTKLSGNLKRHYNRKHQGVKVPKTPRKSPTEAPYSDEIYDARVEIEDFCKSIPDNNVFDISIQDYLALNDTTKKRLAGVRGSCVAWEKKDVLLDPYILGLWLGDGMSSGYGYACHGENDPELIKYFKEWCDNNDANFKEVARCNYRITSDSNFGKKFCNPLAKKLRHYNLIKNKHIPTQYIVNDRDTRLKVLAGIIDTDGTVSRNGTRVVITQGMNHAKLVEDIVLLSRSLGFYTSLTIKNTEWIHKGEIKTGQAYNINISGNLENIPTRLPRKKCSNRVKRSNVSTGQITVNKISDGEYIGFEIDGNKRFVMNDFTVTHNCTNIYSTKFEIDCGDTKTEQRYRQTWSNNMADKTNPSITKFTGKKEGYVKIKYYPDLQKLGGMQCIDDDSYKLMIRRVYDLAATTPEHMKIYLNGKMLKIRTFEKYLDLFLGPSKDAKRVFITLKNQITDKELEKLCSENQAERKKKGQRGAENKFEFKDISPKEIQWDIAVALSNGSLTHTAYVNGIHNPDGGEHVDYIQKKVVRQISDYIKNVKKKDVGSNEHIKNNLWVFVNATIINPVFDSQTKRKVMTKSSKFFYKTKIPTEFIEQLEKRCKITNRVMRISEAMEMEQLNESARKTKKRKIRMAKLDDAKFAGHPSKSEDCVLILTEGDSAKTLAASGLNVIGTEIYGIYPLRGKVLNVQEASAKQLLGNKEYNEFKEIVGLHEGWTIKNRDTLRYGKVMIMTDQDLDGFHIKMGIVNWLRTRFPDLLFEYPDFVECFVTPIVTAEPPEKNAEKLMFFSQQDFEKWKESNPAKFNSYKIRYLKGLGTSNKQDAKKYFENLDTHRKQYFATDKVEACKAIDLAFGGKRTISDRKEWLKVYDENDVLDYSQPKFSYIDSIHKELKHFSTYSYRRAIPSLCDGLKTTQRKILWTMAKQNIWKNEKKVAQIKGAVSDIAQYHHGENSIADAVVKMAQNYVGSNNLNVLKPEGQFGSRRLNGDDASADRYIFTRLEECVKHLFDQRDNSLLEYEVDDNEKPIEPTHYMTTIPLVLVNGAQGTGTGFSTTVPMFNPLDIIDRLRVLMDNASVNSSIKDIQEVELDPLIPWFREFKGTIERSLDDSCYMSIGKWERVDETRIKITELPVGPKSDSFEKYKEWLEKKLFDNQSKAEKDVKQSSAKRKRESTTTSTKRNTSSRKVTNSAYFLKDMESSITDDRAEFILTFQDENTLDEYIRSSGRLKDHAFERTLNLTCNIQYTNMMLFDEKEQLQKYESPEDIIRHFYPIRLKMYHERKKLLIANLQIEVDKIVEKVRFLQMFIDGELKILKQSKQSVVEQLEKHQFKTFEPTLDGPDKYKYLLSIPISSVTSEKIEKFQKQKQEKLDELAILKKTTPKDMWRTDLNNLQESIKEQNAIVKEQENYNAEKNKKGTKRKKGTKKTQKVTKIKL